MKLKKLLSVLLIMTMVLSVCSVAQADAGYDYFVGPLDFSETVKNGFAWKDYDDEEISLFSDGGDNAMKIQVANDTSESGTRLYSLSYNTTGKLGIVYEFDFKRLSKEGDPVKLRAVMNGAQYILQIERNGDVVYTDKPSSYKISNDAWYTFQIKVQYDNGLVFATIKDASGKVINTKSFTQGSGAIRNEMSGKANSQLKFEFFEPGAVAYLDNISIRALEAGEMETVPVSITSTIVAENYDGLNPSPVTFKGGWNSATVLYGDKGWGFNKKGYIIGGNLGTASIKETTAGSTDKYLEFNLDASTDATIEYWYYDTSNLTKNYYIQEVTFKVEENVQYMDYRYRINKNNLSDVFVSRLDFQSDKVYLGSNASSINAEFDFVPGEIYTAKAYYAWDSNKGKIEITDGKKSLVLHGALNSNANTADTVEAPYIRFTSDNTKITGRKVSIYNNNIYTTDERSCELKTRYSNLKLSKSAFEVGTIIASVDVESNASFANCVNGAATLYLAVYENGELAELKAVQVSPENKTFSVENNIGANDTSVKAMLWNVDDGTLTPLFVSEELAKQ